MSWLTPLGFLGLLGLLVLLIIYIIKPNYQNKFLSSTFIWKLSLKYRKKKRPLNKLRNILLILCQILIVVSCALILAQPYLAGEDVDAGKEKIIVIDASANMFAEVEDQTRFERAVTKATELTEETLGNGGTVSVILAGREASMLVQRAGEDATKMVTDTLASLLDPEDIKCTWGNGDIDGAMALADGILAENAKAEVVLFSGTKYIDDGKVTVVDVSDVSEWNVSISNVRAILDEGNYRFEVDVTSYGRSAPVQIILEINGAYGYYGSEDEIRNNGTVKVEYSAMLEADKLTTLTFGLGEEVDVTDLKVSAYDNVFCYVQEDDSLSIDNTFYLYGGTPLPMKIQYYSTKSNNFVSGVLSAIQNLVKDDWDLDIVEIKDSEDAVSMGEGKEPELEGYDVYIFEHHMPKTLPTDGLVILLDPDTLPKNTDFAIGGLKKYTGMIPLEPGETHPIMNNVNPANIGVTWYKPITSYDSGYTPLIMVNGAPVAIAKNEPDSKVFVLSVDIHHTDMAITPEFPMMMYNIINYYIPTTFESNVLEIYDKVTLNSRSEKLTVVGPGDLNLSFTDFPAEVAADAPGIYTVTQIPISGQQIVENFYVTIPDEQCNIVREVDFLTNPYYPPVEEEADIDYVFYFALALVCIAFLEWWLKSREYN